MNTRKPSMKLMSVVIAQSKLAVASFAIIGIAALLNSPTRVAGKANSPDPVRKYADVPLSFEANHGQTNSDVRFLSRGKGYTLFLTSREAVLSLDKLDSRQRRTGTAITMKLQGGSDPTVQGLDPQLGKSNYLISQDSAKWITDIPNYARVQYRQVYPGVDLIFYGNQGQLEYDFVLAPGADPQLIRLSFAGVKKMRVNAAGDLVLQTKGGELRQQRPRIFEERDGVKTEVFGRYVIYRGHQVGFQIASYDPGRTLVIDPVLSFSTYLGTDLGCCDSQTAIAADSKGNAYVTGRTAIAKFPTTPAAYQMDHASGYYDCFVTKLSRDGSTLLYSTYLGGSQDDYAGGIAVDGNGHAYVTGWTHSPNFPTTPGAYQTILNDPPGGLSWSDAFVTKVAPDGKSLVYSTLIGGSSGDKGNSIALFKAVSPFGAPEYIAYLTGDSCSTDFPTTAGALKTTSTASCDYQDAFVAKVAANGGSLLYSTYLGGSGDDRGSDIALNSSGDAYVTAFTKSNDFSPNANGFQLNLKGESDTFVVALYPNGNSYHFGTYLGGGAREGGPSIALDSKGDVYVTGWTNSFDFPTTSNAFQISLGDNGAQGDAFITKLEGGKGSFLKYSTLLGDDHQDVSLSIAVDVSGQAYVTGWSRSTEFPTTSDALRPKNSSKVFSDGFPLSDGFMTKMDPNGKPVYSTLLGGGQSDHGQSIALDVWNFIYVIGTTASDDFKTTPGVVQPKKGGLGLSTNAFIIKMSQ
jgi:hypothetical protein